MHEDIAQWLEADFYFAYPYLSWEGRLNKNTNGLVRQDLKKGSDFTLIISRFSNKMMNKLKTRLKNTLGFITLIEAFLERGEM